MNTHHAPARIAALLAATAMTAGLIGSQLVIAGQYSAEAAAALAARQMPATPPVGA